MTKRRRSKRSKLSEVVFPSRSSQRNAPDLLSCARGAPRSFSNQHSRKVPCRRVASRGRPSLSVAVTLMHCELRASFRARAPPCPSERHLAHCHGKPRAIWDAAVATVRYPPGGRAASLQSVTRGPMRSANGHPWLSSVWICQSNAPRSVGWLPSTSFHVGIASSIDM